MIYSPSLFVYNTQNKVYGYINTSFFSIFERILKLFLYILFFLNLIFVNFLIFYLFFFILFIFFFLNIYAISKYLKKKHS